MNITVKYTVKIWLGVVLFSWFSILDAYPQHSLPKLSKKEKKVQFQQAQADRLFIEGQRFLMLEDYEKAYFYFNKALAINPESGAINFKIAEILARANQLDEALKFGQKAVEADPDNKYYHLLVAEVYSKQKKPALAAEVLNSLMVNAEENQQYILELASLYLNAQEFDKALEALDRAEDYYGVVAQLSFHKQKIYLQKNDLASAVKEGEKLIEAHPGHSQYVLALVEMLFNNGKTDEALAEVLASLEAYPVQPDLHLAAYTLYREKRELETAQTYLVKAFSNPDLAGEVKAKAYAEILRETASQRRDALLEQLRGLMLEHHPKDPTVLSTLGDEQLFAQNKTGALGYYQRALESNRGLEPVLQNTVSLMFELGEDFAEIEKYTLMAVEEFPEKPEFWFFDGTSKLAQKNYQEAASSLQKALELNNGTNKQLTILAKGQLGDTYHYLERKDDAYKAYEEVLALNPDNDHILNNYAYFLSLDKKELQKAKAMSEKLVSKFPTNATYLDTHAWVLFQLKEYEEANQFMKQALDHQGAPSGVMYEHFGDILYQLGKKQEALEYWKKAQGLEDASDLLNKKIKHRQYYE